MSSSVPSLFAQALAIETGRLDDLRIRAWRALGGALSMALRGGTGVPPVMQRFARAAEMIAALDALADQLSLERNDDVIAAFAAFASFASTLPASGRTAITQASVTIHEGTATR